MDEFEQFEKDYNVWTLKDDVKLNTIDLELKHEFEKELIKNKCSYEHDGAIKIIEDDRLNNRNKFMSVSEIKEQIKNEKITKNQICSQIRSVFFDVERVVFQNISAEYLMRIKEQTDITIKSIINLLKEIQTEDQESAAQELNIKICEISELFQSKFEGISRSDLKKE